jgi:hypothetical protein
MWNVASVRSYTRGVKAWDASLDAKFGSTYISVFSANNLGMRHMTILEPLECFMIFPSLTKSSLFG